MITGIDHLIILVDDLDEGIEQYRELGFTVTPGGRHPYGTHNGLVTFQDGAYLELISFYDTSATEHQWHRHLSTGGGLIDHAVASMDLEADIEAAAERGVDLDGPSDGARSRPDGVEIAWRTARQPGSDASALPFVIQDVTDRALRVPGGEIANHANGVLGIDRLVVAVQDLDATSDRYGKLIGTAAQLDEFEGATAAASFHVGPHTVTLCQPDAGTEMARQLGERGDGPFSAVFYRTEEQTLAPARAGNARLSIVAR